jgi:hypothetical protein
VKKPIGSIKVNGEIVGELTGIDWPNPPQVYGGPGRSGALFGEKHRTVRDRSTDQYGSILFDTDLKQVGPKSWL